MTPVVGILAAASLAACSQAGSGTVEAKGELKPQGVGEVYSETERYRAFSEWHVPEGWEEDRWINDLDLWVLDKRTGEYIYVVSCEPCSILGGELNQAGVVYYGISYDEERQSLSGLYAHDLNTGHSWRVMAAEAIYSQLPPEAEPADIYYRSMVLSPDGSQLAIPVHFTVNIPIPKDPLPNTGYFTSEVAVVVVDLAAAAKLGEREAGQAGRLVYDSQKDSGGPYPRYDQDGNLSFIPHSEPEYWNVPLGEEPKETGPKAISLRLPYTGKTLLTQAFESGHWTNKGAKALDFAPYATMSARAAGDGRVLIVDYHSSYGNRVVINHGTGYGEVTYAHLASKSPLVANTDIKADAIVGTMGATGNATGDHLHFEVANSTGFGLQGQGLYGCPVAADKWVKNTNYLYPCG